MNWLHGTRTSALPDLTAWRMTFDRSTLRAALNGVEVTHLFHPREPGSNVLVGVMSPRTVPLVPGSNTLEVRVQGVPVGGASVGLDVDQVTLTVKRVQ